MNTTYSELEEDALMRQYEFAAGKAAGIELKLRILAEIVPELEQYAHKYKFDESHVIAWFAANADPVSADDIATIGQSRVFRNKFLHGDLSTARAKMHSLGGTERRSAGIRIRLDFDAGGLKEQLTDALSAGVGQSVSDTTTADSGIGMWLMEFTLSGDFDQAAAIFAKASRLIDTLINRANRITVRRSRDHR